MQSSSPKASSPLDNSAANLGEASATSNRYAPVNPSQLRESHQPPPTPSGSAGSASQDFPHTFSENSTAPHADETTHSGDLIEPDGLRQRHSDPRGWSQAPYGDVDEAERPGYPQRPDSPERDPPSPPPSPFTYGQSFLAGPGEGSSHGGDTSPRFFGDSMKHRATRLLARRHGLRHPRLLYIYYYIPFFSWIKQYRWSFVPGDLIAACTMASFYIPMSLSYASNLAHVPAINGLYAFAVNPLIYAILGSCPQLIVGPEAAGSLLTGNVVRDSIERGKASDEDGMVLARIAGVVTGVAGAVLLVAGIARVGFLDNVLSRPFLRGFISAIGFVILIDQCITETGLVNLANDVGGVRHGSSVDKIIFLVRNLEFAHPLTCAVSFGTFAVIMVCRELKRRLQPRLPGVAYIPDRFAIVVVTTIMSWKLHWAEKGVAILGSVKPGNVPPFSVHMPFDFGKIKHIETALSTSFMIALLGFFESSVAAKSLRAAPVDGIQNVSRSANRELVALGVANVIGGVFMAIPAFGGYGRSKVNAATGGKTPMSNIFLSLITIACVFVLLPAFHYIPKGVLSAMISVVAWSLIEEAPHDLMFFWRIRGWTELFLIAIVFITTVFYSLEVGIACGIGFSVLRVIKHATRPRIQILGRARDAEDEFENAEADPERFELIEGCLIVKIPEPLTFANTGDLKNRLDRLVEYGTNNAHPALPRIREMRNNKTIIFDIHGVTSLDGAGAQVLSDIMQSYKEKGVRIFCCRVPNPRSKVYKLLDSSGIIDICGGHRHFVSSVKEALRLSELENLTVEFRDDPAA